MEAEWSAPQDGVALKEMEATSRWETDMVVIYARCPDADREGKPPAFARAKVDKNQSVSDKYKPKLPWETLGPKLGFEKTEAISSTTSLERKAEIMLALAKHDGFGKPWTLKHTSKPINKNPSL